jgi:hypothetical protein
MKPVKPIKVEVPCFHAGCTNLGVARFQGKFFCREHYIIQLLIFRAKKKMIKEHNLKIQGGLQNA